MGRVNIVAGNLVDELVRKKLISQGYIEKNGNYQKGRHKVGIAIGNGTVDVNSYFMTPISIGESFDVCFSFSDFGFNFASAVIPRIESQLNSLAKKITDIVAQAETRITYTSVTDYMNVKNLDASRKALKELFNSGWTADEKIVVLSPHNSPNRLIILRNGGNSMLVEVGQTHFTARILRCNQAEMWTFIDHLSGRIQSMADLIKPYKFDENVLGNSFSFYCEDLSLAIIANGKRYDKEAGQDNSDFLEIIRKDNKKVDWNRSVFSEQINGITDEISEKLSAFGWRVSAKSSVMMAHHSDGTMTARIKTDLETENSAGSVETKTFFVDQYTGTPEHILSEHRTKLESVRLSKNSLAHLAKRNDPELIQDIREHLSFLGHNIVLPVFGETGDFRPFVDDNRSELLPEQETKIVCREHHPDFGEVSVKSSSPHGRIGFGNANIVVAAEGEVFYFVRDFGQHVAEYERIKHINEIAYRMGM